MTATRTIDAVMASAVADLPVALSPAIPADDVLDLGTLVGKTVARIDPHPLGWWMRFTDGAMIFVSSGNTFDRAGNFAKEPE